MRTFPRPCSLKFTPLKTNIMSVESRWLEDVFPTEIVSFRGHVSFGGCIFNHISLLSRFCCFLCPVRRTYLIHLPFLTSNPWDFATTKNRVWGMCQIIKRKFTQQNTHHGHLSPLLCFVFLKSIQLHRSRVPIPSTAKLLNGRNSRRSNVRNLWAPTGPEFVFLVSLNLHTVKFLPWNLRVNSCSKIYSWCSDCFLSIMPYL